MREATPPISRQRAMDLVRGLVMVVMVLDHTRDFYFGMGIDPTDLTETWPFLFFTRWITHYCAPGFVMLAGASAYLYGRKRTAAERRRFLLTRGLWLVVLELTVVHFGWDPEPEYSFVLLQVIWAIGWSMVLIAPISSLSPRVLVGIGAAIVILHGLLDSVHLGEASEPGRFLWAVVHEQHMFHPREGTRLIVAYPLVPWVGVMALGFGLGELYAGDARTRLRTLTAVGVGAIVAFVIVRGIDRYGDPSPWAPQADPVFTVMSFLNCTKYPPSLDYLLMTLGPILLLLAAFERFALPEAVARVLETFGRVPLFFYVVHLYLLSISAATLAHVRWGDAAFARPPEGHGGCPEWSLPATYAAWASAIAILYLPCRWFAALKERRAKDWWWLSYT